MLLFGKPRAWIMRSARLGIDCNGVSSGRGSNAMFFAFKGFVNAASSSNEPVMISAWFGPRLRAYWVSDDGSNHFSRGSRWCRTCEPIFPVGVMTTITCHLEWFMRWIAPCVLALHLGLRHWRI